DSASCPTAVLAGFGGSWDDGKPARVHFEGQIMKTVVDTKTDMIFLPAHFFGHGHRRNRNPLRCDPGPHTPLWFSRTCLHPAPECPAQSADLFEKVVSGL